MEATSTIDRPVLSDQQVASLARKKIFFGHQSVGDNVVQGMRDLIAADPRLKIKMESSADPEAVSGPAFVEFHIGENGNPQSKNAAFASILAKGMGAQGGIALYKYCYVDVTPSTDVEQMFNNYRKGISELKLKYPRLTIVHVTIPLTTVEPAAKAWVKSLLGRTTTQDANANRNQFNALLRRTYSGSDPIFDLAEVESTNPDGTRSYFIRNQQKIYTLAAEFTTDGGHLNEAGRRAAAERLLQVLSGL